MCGWESCDRGEDEGLINATYKLSMAIYLPGDQAKEYIYIHCNVYC